MGKIVKFIYDLMALVSVFWGIAFAVGIYFGWSISVDKRFLALVLIILSIETIRGHSTPTRRRI